MQFYITNNQSELTRCRTVIEHAENTSKKEILELKNYTGGTFFFFLALINKARKVPLIGIFYHFNCSCATFSNEEVVFWVHA